MMLRPSEEELAQAKNLGIDPGNMNGPQLRKAIGLAQRREKVVQNPESARPADFKWLSMVARSLGLSAVPRERMSTLKTRVEEQLQKIFAEKGIRAGVTVQYGPKAGDHAGKKAFIEKTDIHWIADEPYIVIRMEEAKAHIYYAHPIALHAIVVAAKEGFSS